LEQGLLCGGEQDGFVCFTWDSEKTFVIIGGLKMVTEDTLRQLDAIQRRASILIQGFSFFMSIQQEVDLRNRIKEEYMKLIEGVINEKTKA
jgi:hypothetical protein